MNVSRVFVQRPVATALFMVAIVLAGLVGLRFLPVSALPEVDYPTIQVRTLYPGGSPDVMSRTVTAPLENQFGQMPGLDRMTSVSSAGVSLITLQFALNINMDVAEQEVQAAMNAATMLLPADLPAPPVYAKVNPADAPVMQLAITSGSLPLTQVQDMVNTRLALKISQISGVGLVTLAGGQRPAVRVQGNLQALGAMGLGLSALNTAVSNGNANSAKGSIDGPTRQYSINANDQLATAADYKNLIVAYANGAPVRLKEVANVIDGAEDDRLAAWTAIKDDPALPASAPAASGAKNASAAGNGVALLPAIILNVQRQPGANVIATVDAIKKQLPALQASLPQSVHIAVLTDRTLGIRASVEHVEMELILAVVMVVLVIFFFLHSLRATVIASIAVPISLMGTIGAMYLLGYSLNNLSLMALTIATGFVVDDAIVMIENISRHLELLRKDAAAAEGARQKISLRRVAMKAALDGAGEIGFTIISLTVSLIAVLIPLLFMQEVIGRLFREFAVTLAITILFSALVSLTLVPMMSARWLEPLDAAHGRLARRIQAGIEWIIAKYDRGLTRVLARQPLMLAVAIATLLLTVFLYWAMPKGLFPTQSTGQLQVQLTAPSDVSFARMSALQAQAARIIADDPAVLSLSSVVGVDGVNNMALSAGHLIVNLKDRPLFGDSEAAIMQRLNVAVSRQVPGVQIYLQPTQDLTIDSDTGPTPYRFDLEGVDTAQVNDWAQRLTQKIATLPEISRSTTDAGATGPAAMVKVDRDTASRLGVTASSLDDALYNAFGQRIVSTIFSQTSQYRVILSAAHQAVSGLAELAEMPVQVQVTSGSATSGGTTPLSSFAQVVEEPAPLQVVRVGQYPAATVGFDITQGVSQGAAVQAIRDAAQAAGLPAAITLRFTGAAGSYEGSLSNQVWLILAAVVCVYIVLGVLYESYVHPLTILSTLPSAGVGALLALWITGHALDVVGIIGLVLLIGIVKKNAIMMIDFAIEAERGRGLPPREAIHQAALLRFRPILMTTLAALAAAVPLMFSFGNGGELRRPLGIAIFGGLVLSQLLTLFTTPVIYLMFDRLGRYLDSKLAAGIDGDGAAGVSAPEVEGGAART
ncbi:MAG: efflux RND transporter permease subunit [Burkholderiaceae bacterium]|jgi:multidrug efflux pump|nr:efflux RND transporter permease subunit [Burkholderiaceae bacterium]